MVDLGSLVLLMSIFGAEIAFVYVILGLAIAVIGGTLIEKMHMETYVEEFIRNASHVESDSPTITKRERVMNAKEQVQWTFRKVFPYILVGVGIGAIIHNWIPQTWIESILGSNNPFGVVLATLVGILMYADIFGTIPIAEALLVKGAQLGTILLYDGGYNSLSAVCNHAEKSSQTKASLDFCSHLYPWYYFCRILFQCIPVSVSIEKNVTLCPK